MTIALSLASRTEGGIEATDYRTSLVIQPEPDYVLAVPATPPTPEDRFAAGYRDAGGPPQLLDHFVANVLPCEGGASWDYPVGHASGYVSRAQFHPGSWATARRHVDVDPTDPYEVGYAVGRWLQLIDEPGGTGGWPVCYWRGITW
jgi:hypothetical protein